MSKLLVNLSARCVCSHVAIPSGFPYAHCYLLKHNCNPLDAGSPASHRAAIGCVQQLQTRRVLSGGGACCLYGGGVCRPPEHRPHFACFQSQPSHPWEALSASLQAGSFTEPSPPGAFCSSSVVLGDFSPVPWVFDKILYAFKA